MWRQAEEGQFGGRFVALSPGEAQLTRQTGFRFRTPMHSLDPSATAGQDYVRSLSVKLTPRAVERGRVLSDRIHPSYARKARLLLHAREKSAKEERNAILAKEAFDENAGIGGICGALASFGGWRSSRDRGRVVEMDNPMIDLQNKYPGRPACAPRKVHPEAA